MFRRKRRYYVTPPTKEQEARLGSQARRNPWDKIDSLTERNDSLVEQNEALSVAAIGAQGELQAVRKEQLLEFFAEQGITTKFSSHNDALTWERDGAKILALPEGWTWDHEIKEEFRWAQTMLLPPSLSPELEGRISVLRLFTPEGRELGKTTSYQSGHATQEPFRNREMLMACQRVLKQLLPEPRNEQPGPTGTFSEGGDE